MGLLASMNCGGWRVSAQRPFIYFNLVIVVVLPSLASHRFGNPFCIHRIARHITAATGLSAASSWIRREQHRYRRTQLLGAGGCCRSLNQTGRASHGCAAGTELGQGAGEDLRQMVLQSHHVRD